MQQELLIQATRFVDRASAAGHRGRIADRAELDSLATAIGRPLPAWLRTLLTSVPVVGLELGIQSWPAEADSDGVEWIEWLSPEGSRFESVELYPGTALLPHGFLCLARESVSGGDQYFVSLEDGDDPSLRQIFHDAQPWIDEAGTLDSGASRIVAPSLSKLFEAARPAA